MPARDLGSREGREAHAKQTVEKALPEVLASSIKAKHGALHSERIADPPVVVKSPRNAAATVHPVHLTIRIDTGGALEVARKISTGYPLRSSRGEGPNATIHNMASSSKRCGRFLNGAAGQEEYLCARTTLYSSLHDRFYPLPEKGAVFSPDVLVFRDSCADDVTKSQYFFVDVISAGTFTYPRDLPSDGLARHCSCGVSYCDDHRNLMAEKMKAVLRIAQMKRSKRLILGAWGSNLQQNHPLEDVAKLWRRVISGSQRQRRPNEERWEGIDEIVFALPDSAHRRAFEKHFHDVISYEPLVKFDSIMATEDEIHQRTPDTRTAGLISLEAIQLRIEQTTNSYSRARLREELRELQRQLNLAQSTRALSATRNKDEDSEVEEGFVIAGYPASDEENNYYPGADTTDSASDVEDARSEIYEFQLGAPSKSGSFTADEDDDFDGHSWVGCPRSDQNGWFHGTIEQLHSLNRHGMMKGSASPQSPLAGHAKHDQGGHSAVEGLLARFQRPDLVDQSE